MWVGGGTAQGAVSWLQQALSITRILNFTPSRGHGQHTAKQSPEGVGIMMTDFLGKKIDPRTEP